MSHIAELVVQHPDLTLTTTLEGARDIDIRVESQPVTVEDTPTLFYLVTTPDFDLFETSLDSDHTVANWTVDAELNGSRVYKITYTNETRFLTPAFTEHGLRILDAVGEEDGWRIRVHAAKRSQLEQFLGYCSEEGVQCRLEKVFSTDVEAHSTTGAGGGMQLTKRQREVARTATEMGYFETEGANAEDVAAALDISPSTLSSHLRTITETLFNHHFRP